MTISAPNSSPSILVVDDEDSPRELLAQFLGMSGYDVVAVPDARSALSEAQRRRFDLVVTDLRMPGMDGIALLAELKEREPRIEVIVMTGFGTVESAVKAIKAGAYDYITKPFNLEETGLVVTRALEYRALRNENEGLRRDALASRGLRELIGYSPSMRDVCDLIGKVADTDVTVLITGESGTGKEVAARAIHAKSRRFSGPMIPVNCGAIPEELLESELFGHEKGAFTGASHTRIGRFEMADGGTVFLDEIGDMSPGLQVKLLRVLQEREFERVGGQKTIKVDVRVVAATRRDLEALIEEGRFREDLYYRLNVIQIQLPPLRERLDDLPVLVEHFIGKHCHKDGRRVDGVTAEVMEAFASYLWPGNVRELENVIERACVLNGGGPVALSELPDKLTESKDDNMPIRFKLPKSGIDLSHALEALERDLISQAMQRTGGVKSRAAQLLGLGRTTLVEKMRKKTSAHSASDRKEPDA